MYSLKNYLDRMVTVDFIYYANGNLVTGENFYCEYNELKQQFSVFGLIKIAVSPFTYGFNQTCRKNKSFSRVDKVCVAIILVILMSVECSNNPSSAQ